MGTYGAASGQWSSCHAGFNKEAKTGSDRGPTTMLVCVCACVCERETKKKKSPFLSFLWTVSVLCLGTRITTITPTFFNCIFIKPGKYHDVRKIKKYYKETKLTASKENIVTTLGCKAQIYMWKKKQARQMFL